MKTHIEPRFDETYVSETLENGLRVIVWHKPEMRTTSCVFATPYGGLDFEMVKENGTKMIHPSGIAHFLEHKMFELEGVDVMNAFSTMGANVNAFTSYNETMYYFSTAAQEIEKPLNLLLDFVQTFDINEESVEKEKGIITQELMMYMQNPDARLYYELFKALFHEHPYKYDIGGTPTSVKNTTLAQLQECYKYNYHPSKMILVCVGPSDPEIILQIVRDNQSKKTFEKIELSHRALNQESETVAKEQLFINMDVASNKVGIAIKLKPWVKTSKERVHQEWAIRLALEAHFSAMNPQFQSWIDKRIINNYFDFDVEVQEDSAFITFANETENHQEFKDFIVKEMKKCMETGISFEQLNLLKKRYFGQAMRVLNDVENIAITTARNMFVKVSIFEVLDILQNLDQQQVKEALMHISLEHVCLVAIVKNNN